MLRLAGFLSLGVKGFGREIRAVGPDDRRGIWIELDLGEVFRVVERFEDTSPFQPGKVDVSCGAIIEEQPELVIADHRDANNCRKIAHSLKSYSRGSIGRIGSERRARSQFESSSSR